MAHVSRSERQQQMDVDVDDCTRKTGAIISVSGTEITGCGFDEVVPFFYRACYVYKGVTEGHGGKY